MSNDQPAPLTGAELDALDDAILRLPCLDEAEMRGMQEALWRAIAAAREAERLRYILQRIANRTYDRGVLVLVEEALAASEKEMP